MILPDGWQSLDLSPSLVSALHSLGFPSLMPIQKAAIPLMLGHCDPLIQAQTGSGKTLAFVVPILQKLLTKISISQKANHLRFLVLSPTREIARQSFDLLVSLSEKINPEMKKHFLLTIGGVPLSEHIAKFASNEAGYVVWFGTVGRVKEIMEYAEQNKKDRFWEVLVNKIDHLYIDEGDRVMQEKGIENVLRRIPKQNTRTAVFSATLECIQDKISKLTRNKAKVVLRTTQIQNNKVISTAIPESLQNEFTIFSKRSDKILHVIDFISKNSQLKTIVFLNTCASVQYYSKLFSSLVIFKNIHIEGVHGQLKPKKREKVFQNFFRLKAGVLVTTDVAARGIDFERIDQIIQIDPPEVPEQLVHRIGRTARVNRPGKALLMLEDHEICFVEYLAGIGIPMEEKTFIPCQNSSEIVEGIVDVLKQDRDLIEKARRGFVSFMRSYKEHQLSHIFRFKKLNIGEIGNSFFLVHLPKIKETYGGSFTKDFKGLDIDIEAIGWKNRNQQLQHEAKLKRREEQKQSELKAIARDIKNIKSLRKKAKRKRDQSHEEAFRKEEKEILRMRKTGKGDQERGRKKQREEEFVDDLSQNTEEIERAIMGDI